MVTKRIEKFHLSLIYSIAIGSPTSVALIRIPFERPFPKCWWDIELLENVFFNFLLYPVPSRIGRGNGKLLLSSPNSGSIVCANSTPHLLHTKAKKGYIIILNTSFLRVDIEPTTCRVENRTLVGMCHEWPHI